MKMGKRVLSIFLVALMLATSIPFAVAEDGIQSSMNTSLNFISDNALGKVLSNAQSEEASNLYGIREVTLSGNSAEASFVAPDNTNLVVAIYEEETNRMLSSGLVAVDSQTEKATVALSAFTLPSYYIVKAFLLDENNAAICKNYENLEHTKIYQEFLEKDVYDFDAQRVMNLDNATDNNFFVVSDQAKVITKSASQNIIRSYDSEEGVYVIQNADNNLKAAKSGDVIYIPDGQQEENYILTKVKTVSVTGSIVTLTEVEDCEIGDLFDYIKIDTEHNTRKNGAKTAPQKSGYADDDSGYDDATYKTGELELKKSYKGTGYEISLSGKIGAYITMKFYYDFHLFGKDYYEIENAVGVKATAESSISVGASVDDLHPLEVVRTGIPVFTGVTAEVAAYIGIEISGSIEAKGTLEFSVEKGFRSTSESGSQQIPFEPKLKTEFELAANVTIDIIPTLELSLKILHVFGVSISVSADFEISFTVPALSINSDDSLIYPEDKHACGIKCVEGELKLIISGQIKADFGLHEEHRKTILTLSLFSFETKIGDFYFSFADGRREFGWGKCPYHMYLATFELKVENSTSTDGIVLKVNGTPLTQKDNKGRYYCYLSPGGHKFTYEAPGYKYAMFGTFDPSFTIFDHGYNTTLILRKEDGGDDPDNPDNPDDPDGPGSSDGIGSNDDLSNLGTQGGIIKFGAYPQTKVTDSATISALNSRASDWKSYGYYSGTGDPYDGQMQPSDYMQYCDVKYGGNKYRGVTLSQYRPYYTGYTSSANNSFQDDSGYHLGTTYWFQYEPLQWKVLDPLEGLVLCINIIDSQPYHNYMLSDSLNNTLGEPFVWGDPGKNHMACVYEYSSLRHWLTHDFYATAFTKAQQKRIGVNQNQNDDGYYDRSLTDDLIFPLSFMDAINPVYGFKSSISSFDTMRLAKGTDYAKSQGLHYLVLGSSFNDGYSDWWLQAGGKCYYSAFVVSGYGSGDDYIVSHTDFGVRPACKILNLASGTSKSANLPHKAASAAKASVQAGTGVYQYSNTACVAGNDYILLNVTGYGSDFTLTTQNLEYIDQLTADESGTVSGLFMPRNAVEGSTTLLIGDFGSGTEARQLTVTGQTPHTHTDTNHDGKCDVCGEQMPEGNKEYKVGDLIQYGTYPQSRVAETPALKNAANSATWQNYYYYIGTGEWNDGQMRPSDYMQYADFFCDGVKYRAVKFSNYRPLGTGYTSSADNSYQDDNGYKTNTTYYFKYEPLTWRVLDPDSGYIMCDSIVDSQAYQNTIYYNGSSYYQSNDLSAFANEYASSSIRKWLNKDFYETAFTLGQKENIEITLLDNSSWNSTYSSVSTSDRIFLLSSSDAFNAAYGLGSSTSSESYRFAQGTDYAKCQGLAVRNTDIYSGDSCWWLRSPDRTTPFTASIVGGTEGIVHNTSYGIRPACKLSTLKADISQTDSLYSSEVHMHTRAEAVFESRMEATCSVEGSYDEVIYCAECGEELSRETVTIPATGEHADADNDGYCDTCEEMMQGGQHCKYCGKIHGGAFGWLVKFFHSIFAIFKR